MVEKVKNTITKPIQHKAMSLVLPGAIHRPIRQFEGCRQVDAPGKQPDQVEKPKVHARHGVVITRIAEIQEAKQLFVDEEKPPEAMVFTWDTLHREAEIRRVSDRREDVPRRRDQQNDQKSAEWSKPLPGTCGEKLPRDEQIEDSCPDREHDADEALQ